MSILLKIIAATVSMLGENAAKKLGIGIGLFWFYFLRIRRKVVFENLNKTMATQKADHYRIARNAYCHFGLSAVEFLRMSTMTAESISSLVDVSGMKNYEEAYARNKGVIVVTAHIGNFDLLAASQTALGIPLALVSKNLHSNGMNRFWMNSRQKFGIQIFSDKGNAKKMLRHLKNGMTLALTADQRTKKERGGVVIPFMGCPAMTGTAPAVLSAISGAPIVPVHIERQSNGRHKAFIEKLIEPPMSKKTENCVQVMSKLNVIIEKWVRNAPEQYMWLHRRFVVDKYLTDLSHGQ